MIDYMCMDHPWHNNHSPRLKIVPYQAIGCCISGPRLDYIARLNRIGAIETGPRLDYIARLNRIGAI